MAIVRLPISLWIILLKPFTLHIGFRSQKLPYNKLGIQLGTKGACPCVSTIIASTFLLTPYFKLKVLVFGQCNVFFFFV